MYRKNRIISSIAVLVFILAIAAAPVWAGSTRLTAETGYQAQDYTMDNPDPNGRNYSGGLDVVYARMATFAAGADEHNTRGYLKCEDVGMYGANGIRVQLYGYTGEYKTTVASSTEAYIYSQSVKFNPSAADPDVGEVWYSKTGGANDTFYKITADFNTMSFGAPSTVIDVVAAWEVEWVPSGATNKSGEAFVAGKDVDYDSPHAIYWVNGATKVKVMEIPKDPASYSCGFAFDNDGNLWGASFTSSGPATQQYIYRWSNADVEAAAGGGTLCTPATADVTIACPTFTDGTTTYYTAASDIECDSDPNGFVYFSLNGGFDEVENTEAGYIMNVAQSIASSETAYSSSVLSTIAKTNPTSGWDWQKALAYDGASDIDGGGYYNPETGAGGNRLYVDQDYGWGTGGPDTVTGLAADADFDGDGVPDSLDNAPESANGDVDDPAYQVDADLDMYGNIADADFDNDGATGYLDFNTFKSEWMGSDIVVDMNSDGSVGISDFNLFKGRWLNSAPYY